MAREGRAFDYQGTFLSRSPDFRADLGFIPRVDFRRTEHEAGYAWFPKDSRVLRFATDVEGGALWDYAGQVQEWAIEPGVEVELPGQTEIGARHWQEMERFEGIDFRLHTSALYASTSWISWLGGSAFYRWGTGINYYPGEGLVPLLAATHEVEAKLTLRPTSQLRFEETYLFSRLPRATATCRRAPPPRRSSTTTSSGRG